MFEKAQEPPLTNITQKFINQADDSDWSGIKDPQVSVPVPMPHPKLRQLKLKKMPPEVLEFSPSVDSTPRGVSMTGVSLTSSISSIFLSPTKLEKVCQNKLVKMKEKILKSEISQDFAISSDNGSILQSGRMRMPKNTIEKTTESKKLSPQKSSQINLESVGMIEDKIWTILNLLSEGNQNIKEYCEEWWEISQDEDILGDMGKLYKDDKQKNVLKIASVVEVIAISLAYLTSMHNESVPSVIVGLLK